MRGRESGEVERMSMHPSNKSLSTCPVKVRRQPGTEFPPSRPSGLRGDRGPEDTRSPTDE